MNSPFTLTELNWDQERGGRRYGVFGICMIVDHRRKKSIEDLLKAPPKILYC
jgi:hypothetical protein